MFYLTTLTVSSYLGEYYFKGNKNSRIVNYIFSFSNYIILLLRDYFCHYSSFYDSSAAFTTSPVVQHVIELENSKEKGTGLNGYFTATQKDAFEKLYAELLSTRVRRVVVTRQNYVINTNSLIVTTRLYVDQPESTSTMEAVMLKLSGNASPQLKKFLLEDLKMTVISEKSLTIQVESTYFLPSSPTEQAFFFATFVFNYLYLTKFYFFLTLPYLTLPCFVFHFAF